MVSCIASALGRRAVFYYWIILYYNREDKLHRSNQREMASKAAAVFSSFTIIFFKALLTVIILTTFSFSFASSGAGKYSSLIYMMVSPYEFDSSWVKSSSIKTSTDWLIPSSHINNKFHIQVRALKASLQSSMFLPAAELPNYLFAQWATLVIRP